MTGGLTGIAGPALVEAWLQSIEGQVAGPAVLPECRTLVSGYQGSAGLVSDASHIVNVLEMHK